MASGEYSNVLPKLISGIGNGRRSILRECPSSLPTSTAEFFTHGKNKITYSSSLNLYWLRNSSLLNRCNILLRWECQLGQTSRDWSWNYTAIYVHRSVSYSSDYSSSTSVDNYLERKGIQFLGLLFPILILLISSSFQTIRFWLGCALFFTYSWRHWWAFSTGKSETTQPSYLTMLAWFFSTRYSFFTPL